MNAIKPLDFESVFLAMNACDVDYILIGGLNYYLAFRPVSTQDIDLFIDDEPENRNRCEKALTTLDAEWGKGDYDWGPVATKSPGWLSAQGVYCLLTNAGPVDIFRSLAGVESYAMAKETSVDFCTSFGTAIKLLSPQFLLACQLAIPEHARRIDRVRHLQEILGK
jgi:hypothetical protein